MTTPDLSKSPTTVSELRLQLKTLGDPWTVAGHLDDDDPLPLSVNENAVHLTFDSRVL